MAHAAEDAFNNTFAKGGVPEDIQEIDLQGGSLPDSLVKSGVIPSKAEWRRLIDGGGIKKSDDTKITDPNFKPQSGDVLKIGKRRFVKIV